MVCIYVKLYVHIHYIHIYTLKILFHQNSVFIQSNNTLVCSQSCCVLPSHQKEKILLKSLFLNHRGINILLLFLFFF